MVTKRSSGGGGNKVAVSLRSPDFAVTTYDALSRAIGLEHQFIEYRGFGWSGSVEGRMLALDVAQRLERQHRVQGGPAANRWRMAAYRQFVQMKYDGIRSVLGRVRPHVVYVWNAEREKGRVLAQAARDLDIRVLVFEHSPIPGTLTIDPEGVNARASVPRDPAFFLTWAKGRAPGAWRDRAARLIARKPRRPVGAGPTELPENFVFLPLQVANDTQIILNGGWVPSIKEMLRMAIRQIDRLPPGWSLVVKEHPSCRIGNADVLALNQDHPRLVVSEANDTFDLVRRSRGVLTLNSSVGLQSFFFDKPVLVLGDAFYRQPGLVETAESEADLGALFSRAADWTFDARLRDAFMTWLCDEYYVPIDESDPSNISERAADMVRRQLQRR